LHFGLSSLLQLARLRRSVAEERVHDALVGQGRNIAHVPVVECHFSEDPAHDFAGAGLRKARGVLYNFWGRERANLFANYNTRTKLLAWKIMQNEKGIILLLVRTDAKQSKYLFKALEFNAITF